MNHLLFDTVYNNKAKHDLNGVFILSKDLRMFHMIVIDVFSVTKFHRKYD